MKAEVVGTMRSWSIPAGRLFGVDIRIHLTFLFLLAFVWFTQSVAMGTSGAIRGVALVAIMFAAWCCMNWDMHWLPAAAE